MVTGVARQRGKYIEQMKDGKKKTEEWGWLTQTQQQQQQINQYIFEDRSLTAVLLHTHRRYKGLNTAATIYMWDRIAFLPRAVPWSS